MSKRKADLEVSAGGSCSVGCPMRRPRYLLIRDSYDNWGFPKGHLENGESPAEAAIRETAEETGLSRLVLQGPIRVIDWHFRFRGRHIHKYCHFFLFESPEGEPVPRWTRASPPASGGRWKRRWTSSATTTRAACSSAPGRWSAPWSRSAREGRCGGRTDAWPPWPRCWRAAPPSPRSGAPSRAVVRTGELPRFREPAAAPRKPAGGRCRARPYPRAAARSYRAAPPAAGRAGGGLRTVPPRRRRAAPRLPQARGAGGRGRRGRCGRG